MGIFDSKNFNGEVFQKYVETIPNTKRNELIKSRAIRQRPDLAQAMADQTGGNYITTPLLGLISGSAATNYDGSTNISPKGTQTFTHSRVVVGRSNGWTEKDFSYDITGGTDFMENVARQISEYWDEIDQATLVHILNGIFKMNDTEGAKFVQSHTNDVTAKNNSEGVTGKMDGTTLNTTMQKACGDNKSRFSLAIMHSVVATNLENLKLLVYLKYNDENGMERDLSIGTLNGRMVLVDDDMPVVEETATAGVYTVTIGGTYVAADTVTVAGATHTVVEDHTTNAEIAAALVTALAADTKYTVKAGTGAKANVLTFTEKTGKYGSGAPTASKTSTNGTVTVATVTEPIEEDATKYTTYVLGDGAIEFTDCGAKVPYEMDRDPKTNGGEDTLYSRQRKCFAPYGINFTKASMATLSPTDEELETGANWELVNNGQSSTARKYINSKAIAIARIISLG